MEKHVEGECGDSSGDELPHINSTNCREEKEHPVVWGGRSVIRDYETIHDGKHD
jgi:hypothetical protein